MKPSRTRVAVLAVGRGARMALALSLAAPTWYLIFGVGGIALIIHGVHSLYGAGWASIAGGVASLFAAWMLGRGMANG